MTRAPSPAGHSGPCGDGRERITVVLGAGSSIAYAPDRYPSLQQLLKAMLGWASRSPDHRKARQYLAYTLAISCGDHASAEAVHSGHNIDCIFNRMIAGPPRELAELFKCLDTPETTRAYWALTYSIAAYMVTMAAENNNAPSQQLHAHRELVRLLQSLHARGARVSVIDFNYDCLLEHARVSYGSVARFQWDIGRKRLVFPDSGAPLSQLAEKSGDLLDGDLDGTAVDAVTLIKPHGDMCTFLRGRSDVYYRGGRHSHVLTATFPPSLSDISEDDGFVRSSIMPPTLSRRLRHKCCYYTDEELRLKRALSSANTVIVLGWSARGTDGYYVDLLSDLREARAKRIVHVIDKGRGKTELVNRLRCLLGDGAEFRTDMAGFSKESVARLARVLGQ